MRDANRAWASPLTLTDLGDDVFPDRAFA